MTLAQEDIGTETVSISCRPDEEFVSTNHRTPTAQVSGMAALGQANLRQRLTGVGRSAPRRRRPARRTLYLGLFRHFPSIIDFDAEVTDGTFQPRVS